MKNKGFVMIETIVVITIITVGLISLYASYTLILSKATTKNYYDDVEHIYKTYFVGKYLVESNHANFTGNFKTLDLSNKDLESIAMNFEIQKIYLAKGSYNNIISKSNLITLDGSTIDYLKALDSYDEQKLNIIVKYREKNSDPVLNITNFASIAL